MQTNKIKKYTGDIKDLPIWLKYVVAVATIFGGFGLYSFFSAPIYIQVPVNNTVSENATSTISISNLLSKALALDTIIERQDFLTKYIGDQVYGESKVKQISRYGDKFFVDFNINNQIISCPQDNNEKNEKQLLFLKGKTVKFVGIFTYEKYFENGGLIIDNCVLQK